MRRDIKIEIKEYLKTVQEKIDCEDKLVYENYLLHKYNKQTLIQKRQSLYWDQLTLNTWDNILDEFIDNSNKNCKLKARPVETLLQKWKKENAIAVAFGPSLKKNIEHVKRLQKKGYKIIAVDVACNYLKSNGIEPDVVCIMDTKIPASACPPDININKTKLVANIGASNKFIQRFYNQGGDVYYICTEDRLNVYRWMINKYKIKNVMRIPGNVGNAAILIALSLLYCKKLLLAGYDYAFGEYYYPDTKTPDNISKIKLIDINNSECYTNEQLCAYAELSAKMISECENGFERVINCTDGGIMRLPLIDKLENY